MVTSPDAEEKLIDFVVTCLEDGHVSKRLIDQFNANRGEFKENVRCWCTTDPALGQSKSLAACAENVFERIFNTLGDLTGYYYAGCPDDPDNFNGFASKWYDVDSQDHFGTLLHSAYHQMMNSQ